MKNIYKIIMTLTLALLEKGLIAVQPNYIPAKMSQIRKEINEANVIPVKDLTPIVMGYLPKKKKKEEIILNNKSYKTDAIRDFNEILHKAMAEVDYIAVRGGEHPLTYMHKVFFGEFKPLSNVKNRGFRKDLKNELTTFKKLHRDYYSKIGSNKEVVQTTIEKTAGLLELYLHWIINTEFYTNINA
jgi:hypothetical protein